MQHRTITSDRERAEFRKFREEEEAREQSEREQRERPIRDAEAKLNDTHRQLREIEVQVLTGTVPDPDLWIDERVAPGVSMTPQEAEAFVTRESNAFTTAHPDYFKCSENSSAILRYFEANGIKLFTAAMLECLVSRFRHAGLLKEAPEPEPMATAEPELAPSVSTEPQPEPGSLVGIDPSTGEPRTYSAYEVDRMSADEFRRAAGVTVLHYAGPPMRRL